MVTMETRGRVHARKIYTQQQFDNDFRLPPKKPKPFKENLKQNLQKSCSCNQSSILEKFVSLFPIVSTIRNYKLREYAAGDIIAGVSVGIMHIPLGMGFAMLASVLPVYGLYSSFFQVILYAIFGTSRHVSFGTMAIISIMLSTVVDRETDLRYPDARNYSSFETNETLSYDVEKENFKIGVAMTVCMLVGIFQIGMGLARLGLVTVYLSPPFVGGFTTGAGVHAATSQLISVLGIQVTKHKGVFKLPKLYVEILKKIPEVNIAAFIIGALTFLTIFLVKQCINQRFKSKLRIPIPIEIIVVILATLVTHFAHLDELFDVKIIGEIKQGLPTPVLPPMDNVNALIMDSFIIAVVSFTISVSVAKFFTQRHDYSIDTNQEFIAYGISHFISSFFWSFAGAVAPPRSLVHESTGGKTQVANFIASIVIILVILAAGPLLRTLPLSSLAALVIVSFTGIFMQFLELEPYWKANKYDFAIWVVTFLAVFVTDIDVGLAIGIGFSLISIVIRTQFPKTYSLSEVSNLGIFVNSNLYDRAQASSNIKIVRFESPLYFANSELLKTRLFKIVHPETSNNSDSKINSEDIEANPIDFDERDKINSNPNTDNFKINREDIEANPIDFEETDKINSNPNMNNFNSISELNKISTDATAVKESEIASFRNLDTGRVAVVILDCSAVSFIDSTGVKSLAMIHKEYAKSGIQIFLAGCTETVHEALWNSPAFIEHVSDDCIYVTLGDAYSAAQKYCLNPTEFNITSC